MKKMIITISRQFGSGGLKIAEELSKALNIPVYDKEIVHRSALESGLKEETLLAQEESLGVEDKGLHTLFGWMGDSLHGMMHMSASDQMFLMESSIIESIASEGSAIFVGRCADYILENEKDAIHIYVHADLSFRKKRVEEQYGVLEGDSLKMIEQIDRRRRNYYEFYTKRRWGDSENYHLVIDTARFGIEVATDMILNAIKETNEKKR